MIICKCVHKLACLNKETDKHVYMYIHAAMKGGLSMRSRRSSHIYQGPLIYKIDGERTWRKPLQYAFHSHESGALPKEMDQDLSLTP